MKKLLVLALSVVMVLSFAAVSMAAVTVSGEVNFGWTLTSGAEADFGDAKIAATGVLNDEVTAFAAMKANVGGWSMTAGPIVPGTTAESGLVLVDEAWVKFTEGFGTVKVGYYGWDIKENVDALSAGYELKGDMTISADFNVAEGMVLSACVVRPDTTIDMGAKFKYSADAFGVSAGYDKKDADTDAHIALNGWYNFAPAKVYLTYTMVGDVNNAVLGLSYDSDSFYGYVETEAVVPDGDKADSDVRLGYKLGNGVKLEYNTLMAGLTDTTTSSIKINCAF